MVKRLVVLHRHFLIDGAECLAPGRALRPAVDRCDAIGRADLLAVVEKQSVAQRDRPGPTVVRDGVPRRHLRARRQRQVNAEQRVIDHVTVVDRDRCCGPDRIDTGEIGLRRATQHLGIALGDGGRAECASDSGGGGFQQRPAMHIGLPEFQLTNEASFLFLTATIPRSSGGHKSVRGHCHGNRVWPPWRSRASRAGQSMGVQLKGAFLLAGANSGSARPMHRPSYPLGKLRRGVAVGVAELFLGQARCAAEVSSPLRRAFLRLACARRATRRKAPLSCTPIDWPARDAQR